MTLRNDLNRSFNNCMPDARNEKPPTRYLETDYHVVARLMFEHEINSILSDIEQGFKK